MANAPSNKMQRRIQVILFCMAVVGFSILLGRLYYLQIVEGDKYQSWPSPNRCAPPPSAPSGEILDTNGKVLARAAPRVVERDPSPGGWEGRCPAEPSGGLLSELLDGSAKDHRQRQNKNVLRAGQIQGGKGCGLTRSPSSASTTRSPASTWRRTPAATTPMGHLASTVLGFTGSENKGAYGLEALL